MTSPSDPGQLLRDAAARHQAAQDAAKTLSQEIHEQREADAGKGVEIKPDASSVQ
jgi:hypothetical protein